MDKIQAIANKYQEGQDQARDARIASEMAKRTHLDKFDASLYQFVDQMRMLAMGPMLANKKLRDTLEEALEPVKECMKDMEAVGDCDFTGEEGDHIFEIMTEFYHAVRCAINDNDSADADTANRIKQMGKD